MYSIRLYFRALDNSYPWTNEIIKTETTSSISMNWGYSGSYDNIFYSPYDTDWNAGGHNFNLDHSILIRSDIQ